jgi:hypothetical protein
MLTCKYEGKDHQYIILLKSDAYVYMVPISDFDGTKWYLTTIGYHKANYDFYSLNGNWVESCRK